MDNPDKFPMKNTTITPAQYRAARIARGLDQKALAALLGITREAVGHRERGITRISPESVLAMSAIPVQPPVVPATKSKAKAKTRSEARMRWPIPKSVGDSWAEG